MKSDLKRAFTSSGFFFSILVFLLCLQGYSLPVYCNQWCGEWSAPIELRASAFELTIGSIFFGGAILLLPFCAAISYSSIQADDVRSSLLNWSLLRSSVRSYGFHKITSAFLSGAAMAGIAFGIHAFIWHILALPYHPAVYPNHEIGFWSESFFNEWSNIYHALPIVLEIMLGMALTAGIWSVVAATVAIWIPDKLLIVIVPVCIYKLWSANLTYYLFGFRLPSPDTLFNDAQTVRGDLECLLAYGVFFILVVIVYLLGLKRRACHA